MEFILSMGYSDEEAFWLFTCLLESFVPIDYFTTMNGLFADLKILKSLIDKHANGVSKKFDKMNINLDQFVSKWFLTLYTGKNKEVVEYFWDLIFLEGKHSLIKSALSIILLLSKEINSSNDEGKYFEN